jgi:very-short-patch-repair endonuclease
VSFPGLGRVDLVVEDWIVVETDGSAFHDVEVTARDRRRDAALIARGLAVLRFRYSQVVFNRPELVAAVISAVETHRRVLNAGSKARRARRRAERLELT